MASLAVALPQGGLEGFALQEKTYVASSCQQSWQEEATIIYSRAPLASSPAVS
jgi:hypothetical protein